MQQLLDHVKEIRKEKLAALKVQLEEQEKAALADLQAEVDHLQAEVERLRDATMQQAKSKKQFLEETAHRFAAESYKLELLQQIWQEVAESLLTKPDQAQTWLADQLNSLDGTEGEITVGASRDLLTKLIKKDKKLVAAKLKIKHNPQMKEAGFIFEGKTKIIDARLSVFLNELFQKHRTKLYQAAFK